MGDVFGSVGLPQGDVLEAMTRSVFRNRENERLTSPCRKRHGLTKTDGATRRPVELTYRLEPSPLSASADPCRMLSRKVASVAVTLSTKAV